MSTKGPSQRNAGIAILVYSTLGPSLSLLPNEDKSDWVIVESAEEKRDVFVPARDSGGEAEVIDTIHADVQPSVTRPPATNEETTSNTAELSNLYSNSTVQTTAERRGGRRLGFNYKSSAGSSSSQEQATLLKEDSFNMEEGTEAVSPPLSKQLQDQISKNSAVEAASRYERKLLYIMLLAKLLSLALIVFSLGIGSFNVSKLANVYSSLYFHFIWTRREPLMLINEF